jgi:hypothetical protein
MDEVRFRLIVPKDEGPRYETFLQEGGLATAPPEVVETSAETPLVEAKFVELLALVAAGTAAAFAMRLFDLLVQKRENGTVIDFRKDPCEISLVANVPYGTLVVIDKDGKSHIQKIDPNQTADPTSFITGIVEKYTGK